MKCTTAHKFTNTVAYEPDLAARNDDNTTSFDKGHGLVDATAAIASILGVPVPPPPAEDNPYASCTADGPVLTDPAGDATLFASADGVPNEPGLDITELHLSDDATANVTFVFTLDDLKPDPAALGLGNSIEAGFSYAGKSYEVSVKWANGGDPSSSFGISDATLGYTELSAPPLVLDFDADTIAVKIPMTDFDPDVQKGSAFSDFLVRTRYDDSPTPLGPVADDTTGVAFCPYTVGYGAIPPPVGSEPPPPPPDPDPTPDATLSLGGVSYNWDGESSTAGDLLIDPLAQFALTGKAHDIKLVRLNVAPGTTGTLTVTVTNPATSYLLFEIRDKDNNRLEYSEGLPTEEITLTVPNLPAGDYFIDVGYFVAVEAAYSATASLT